MSDTFSTHPGAGNEFQYRTISKAAVASLALAILGVGAFVFKAFVLLPVLAIGFGFVSLMEISKYPEEVTGLVVSGGTRTSTIRKFLPITYECFLTISSRISGLRYHFRKKRRNSTAKKCL